MKTHGGMIHEVIVTTLNPDATVHIAPMGVQCNHDRWEIAPYRPSRTLDNMQRDSMAVINFTDDVRIFAGCICGKRQWPTIAGQHDNTARLTDTLSHIEVRVDNMQQDPLRSRFYCKELYEEQHASFHGFNRAQWAVIEAAILISRLDRLPIEEIMGTIDHLTIAVEKTAGSREQEAWQFLMHHLACAQKTGVVADEE